MRRLLALALLAALAACGGKGEEAPGDKGAPPVEATPSTPATTAPPTPPSPATPAVNAQVEALVQEGKVKFAMGEYQASLDAMNRALAIDPVHAEAKVYMLRAEGELAKSAPAATPAPATPEAAPSQEDQGKPVATLLEEAAALVKAEKYAAPPGDNALEKYRLILSREPLNREVREQLAAAIGACKSSARAQLSAGNTARALDYLAQAKAMAPTDAEVLAMLQETGARIAGGTPEPPAPAASPAPSPAPSPTASTPAPETPAPAPATPAAAPPSPQATAPATAGTPAPEPTPTAPPTPTPPPPVNGVRAAWLEQKAPAVYPRTSWDQGHEGTTRLKVLVTVDGKIGEVMIEKGSGHIELDKAAVDAARKYVFKPALEASRPVAQWVTVEVVFDKP